MKSFMILLTLTVLAWNVADSQNPTREQYLKGYEQRAEYFASYYDTSTAVNFNSIGVRYAHNHDIKTADSMFVEVLKDPKGDMFWMYPCISAYVHGKDKVGRNTRNRSQCLEDVCSISRRYGKPLGDVLFFLVYCSRTMARAARF